MPQVFHVLRCFHCDIFQVQQVKKVMRWSCKVCGEKQSVIKEYGRGSAAECRKHVQKLNSMKAGYEKMATCQFLNEDNDEDDGAHFSSPIRPATEYPLDRDVISSTETAVNTLQQTSKWEKFRADQSDSSNVSVAIDNDPEEDDIFSVTRDRMLACGSKRMSKAFSDDVRVLAKMESSKQGDDGKSRYGSHAGVNVPQKSVTRVSSAQTHSHDNLKEDVIANTSWGAFIHVPGNLGVSMAGKRSADIVRETSATGRCLRDTVSSDGRREKWKETSKRSKLTTELNPLTSPVRQSGVVQENVLPGVNRGENDTLRSSQWEDGTETSIDFSLECCDLFGENQKNSAVPVECHRATLCSAQPKICITTPNSQSNLPQKSPVISAGQSTSFDSVSSPKLSPVDFTSQSCVVLVGDRRVSGREVSRDVPTLKVSQAKPSSKWTAFL